ncbi:MAG: hypothetical protein methR_P3921 [Methyloprofundus sp.]|nr:MAG: hypothetical protein methR_P3921 [Methyloprofundus sp.]
MQPSINDEDILNSPLSVFFKAVILKTPQGWAFLAGCLVQVVLPGIAYFFPHFSTQSFSIIVFFAWFVPSLILLTGMLVKDDFRSSWEATIVIIIFMYWLA